jgi:hypothetical protein
VESCILAGMFTDDFLYPVLLPDRETPVDEIVYRTTGEIVGRPNDDHRDSDSKEGIDAGDSGEPDQDQSYQYPC